MGSGASARRSAAADPATAADETSTVTTANNESNSNGTDTATSTKVEVFRVDSGEQSDSGSDPGSPSKIMTRTVGAPKSTGNATGEATGDAQDGDEAGQPTSPPASSTSDSAVSAVTSTSEEGTKGVDDIGESGGGDSLPADGEVVKVDAGNGDGNGDKDDNKDEDEDDNKDQKLNRERSLSPPPRRSTSPIGFLGGVLEVTILRAEGVKKMDIMSMSDVFAVVTFGREEVRTSVKSDTDSCEWGAHGLGEWAWFFVPATSTTNLKMRLSLWDEDDEIKTNRSATADMYNRRRATKEADDFIGSCDVDIEGIGTKARLKKRRASFDGDDVQQSEVRDKQGKVTGTIFYKLRMLNRKEEISATFWRTLLRVVDCDGDASTVSIEDATALLQFLEASPDAADAVKKRMFPESKDPISIPDAVDALVSVSSKFDLVSARFPADVVTGRSLAGLSPFEKECYLLQSLDHGNSNRMTAVDPQEDRLHNSWMAALANDWSPPQNPKHSFVSTRQVRNRATGMLEDEYISSMVWLSLKAIYSKLFLEGICGLLDVMTAKMNVQARDPKQAAQRIQHFIKQYSIDTSAVRDPIDSFDTLNDFFVRRLKPEARPIASPHKPHILISAADCRLMTFTTVSAATKAWVKGNRFTVKQLLGGNDELAASFENGAMTIFRLAPQDYHCFHFPCSGTLVSSTMVPGKLYSVNPIVVQHERVNVFTENVRCISIFDSPEFGQVAFIAVGATIIGSINNYVEPGTAFKKGDLFG